MKTILIADDEESLRKLMHTTLEDPSYSILLAADGLEALEAARNQRPDLVILDWMMPGMTGLEVARELRADPTTASIPILMVTAMGQERDRKQGVALGVQAYLVKPFSPLELLRKVQEIFKVVEFCRSDRHEHAGEQRARKTA